MEVHESAAPHYPLVAKPQREKELEALRRSVRRASPHRDEQWEQRTAKVLGIESTLRSRGRPRLPAKQVK
jgi:putative transposase